MRSFRPLVAILLTYCVGAMLAATGFSNLGDYAVMLVFVLAVYVLESDSKSPFWIVPAGGLIAAFELLIKVNGGIVSVVILSLVAWRCRPGDGVPKPCSPRHFFWR